MLGTLILQAVVSSAGAWVYQYGVPPVGGTISQSTISATTCFEQPANGSNFEVGCNSNNNVGIGTTSPQTKLHISSGALLIDGNSGTPFQIGGTTLTVTQGNVGLGTTNPAAQLTVGPAFVGSAPSTLFTTNAGALGTTSGNTLSLGSIGFTSSPNAVVLGVRAYRTAAGTDWTTTGIAVGMDVDNTVNAGAYIDFDHSGKVGIGTTAPAYKLDVVGQINTNTGVSLNGTLYTNPDYVFEPNYPLMPLDRIKVFTAKEKHLPHVPSTKEVKKKGVEIFEQNRVVLENLEEAYLYLFQMDAKLRAQQAEIEALRAEMRSQGQNALAPRQREPLFHSHGSGL